MFNPRPLFPHDTDIALAALAAVENTAMTMGGEFDPEMGIFRLPDGLEATIMVRGKPINCQLFQAHNQELTWVAIPKVGERLRFTYLGTDNRQYRVTHWSEGLPIPA